MLLGNRSWSLSIVSVAITGMAIIACSISATARADDEALLKVGFAEADITPEPGMEKPGGYHKSRFEKTHDPCKVRVAVFDDGKKRAALVCVDTLMVPRHLVKAVRKSIHQKCGIAPEAVLIGASHSHTSGPLGMVQPGQYDHASELVQKLAYEMSSAADPKYVKTVHEAIVDAVCRAESSRVEAACDVGLGHEEQVAFNRRFRMKNGLTFTHPGKRNPDIIEPAAPIDPEVGVLAAWDHKEKTRLLGCVVNYACHATTGAPGWSANWIYDMEQAIRGMMGEDVIVVFMQGDCGDITQVDNLCPYPTINSRVVGGRVGAEAVKTMLLMTPGPLGPVDYAAKVWNIPRRPPNAEKVKELKELAEKDFSKIGTWEKETLMLDALMQSSPEVEVEVQAVQVGPAVFVTNPAEMFVEFGLELKRKSPFPFTFPVELANGCVGYVPTEEALGPGGGGYETRLTSYSNLEVTAGQQMLDAGLGLVNQMKPGKKPLPPESPPSNRPWSYGNVPPQLD